MIYFNAVDKRPTIAIQDYGNEASVRGNLRLNNVNSGETLSSGQNHTSRVGA
jgi:hypothetical protein